MTTNYSQTYAYSKIGNITSFAGNSYAYSGGKPHAVTPHYAIITITGS